MGARVAIVQVAAGDARRYIITFYPEDGPAFQESVNCSTQGDDEQKLAADYQSVGRVIANGRAR